MLVIDLRHVVDVHMTKANDAYPVFLLTFCIPVAYDQSVTLPSLTRIERVHAGLETAR